MSLLDSEFARLYGGICLFISLSLVLSLITSSFALTLTVANTGISLRLPRQDDYSVALRADHGCLLGHRRDVPVGRRDGNRIL
jgi:hypothetical protein